MKKSIVLASLAISSIASATPANINSINFAAPIVQDSSNLPGDVPFGSIVFDNTSKKFLGLANTGAWQVLSNASGLANTALSNLSSTAINADLNPAAANTIKLGSSTNYFQDVQSKLINGITVGTGGGSVLSNVAVGYHALNSNSSGYDNVAIGTDSLMSSGVSRFNVAIGSRALPASWGVIGNVIIGTDSFTSYTGSGGNTFNTSVGYNNANNLTSGWKNTLIGANITALSSNMENHVIVADGDGNRRIVVNASGNAGIGVDTPSTKLQVSGVISPSADDTYTLGTSALRFTEVFATNGTINTSDAREKKQIQDSDLGLAFIQSLRPVSYRWKNQNDTKVHYGLIAQETQKAIYETKGNTEVGMVVHDIKADRFGLNYSELISPIIRSIQELASSTENENNQLKAENAELKKRLEKLEAAVFAK